MTRDHSKRAGRRRKVHLLRESTAEIHAANAHIPPDEIQKIVDEAVRAERRPHGSSTGRPARGD